MLNEKSVRNVRAHFEKHPFARIEVSTTLNPGYVSCIRPIPSICGAEVYCRQEDATEVRQIKDEAFPRQDVEA